MTVLEMHNAVQLGLDKSASFEIAAFEPEDIDYWLNEAQTELIKRKAFGNNYRGESYGQGIKRMEDLSPLVEYSARLEYKAQTGPLKAHAYHPNVCNILIKDHIPEYLYYVGADFLVQDPYAPTVTIPQETKLVEENVIGNLIATPYNQPVLRNTYVYLKEGEVNFIYDPYATPVATYVSYIKKPGILVRSNPSEGQVTTSDLPEHVHPEIVALTVSMMLENIESPRFQSNLITLNNKE